MNPIPTQIYTIPTPNPIPLHMIPNPESNPYSDSSFDSDSGYGIAPGLNYIIVDLIRCVIIELSSCHFGFLVRLQLSLHQLDSVPGFKCYTLQRRQLGRSTAF